MPEPTTNDEDLANVESWLNDDDEEDEFDEIEGKIAELFTQLPLDRRQQLLSDQTESEMLVLFAQLPLDRQQRLHRQMSDLIAANQRNELKTFYFETAEFVPEQPSKLKAIIESLTLEEQSDLVQELLRLPNVSPNGYRQWKQEVEDKSAHIITWFKELPLVVKGNVFAKLEEIQRQSFDPDA